jgi:hypothetical protein
MTTGGTIASRRSDSGSVLASVSGHDLHASLHEPLTGIEPQVEEFCNLGSYAIDLTMAHALARGINRKLANDDCDGVVGRPPHCGREDRDMERLKNRLTVDAAAVTMGVLSWAAWKTADVARRTASAQIDSTL